MPIEIREILIKGTIGGGSNQSGGSNSTGSISEEEKNDIISKAVDNVLQILEDKKNR